MLLFSALLVLGIVSFSLFACEVHALFVLLSWTLFWTLVSLNTARADLNSPALSLLLRCASFCDFYLLFLSRISGSLADTAQRSARPYRARLRRRSRMLDVLHCLPTRPK